MTQLFWPYSVRSVDHRGPLSPCGSQSDDQTGNIIALVLELQRSLRVCAGRVAVCCTAGSWYSSQPRQVFAGGGLNLNIPTLIYGSNWLEGVVWTTYKYITAQRLIHQSGVRPGVSAGAASVTAGGDWWWLEDGFFFTLFLNRTGPKAIRPLVFYSCSVPRFVSQAFVRPGPQCCCYSLSGSSSVLPAKTQIVIRML